MLWKAFKYQPVSLLFLISLFNLKKVRVIFQNMLEETKSFISIRPESLEQWKRKIEVAWKNHRWNHIFSMSKKKRFKTYERLITSFNLGFIERASCMAALAIASSTIKKIGKKEFSYYIVSVLHKKCYLTRIMNKKTLWI